MAKISAKKLKKGDGCSIYIDGGDVDVVALWAALTDEIVRRTGAPIEGMVTVTDAWRNRNRGGRRHGAT